MKFNTSFSSLPTGTHLYREDFGGGRFVFQNAEERKDAIDISRKSIKEVMEFGPKGEREVLDSSVKNTGERRDLQSDVESQEEILTKEYLTQKSDAMRANAKILATARLEKAFGSIENTLNEALIKILKPEVVRYFVENGIPLDGEITMIEVNKWLESLTDSEKEEKQKEILAKNGEFLASLVEKNSWFERELLAYDAQTRNTSQSAKTQHGNALGMGITTFYITGMIWGASSKGPWLASGAAALLGGFAPGATADGLRLASRGLDGLGNGVNWTFTKVNNLFFGIARLDAGMLYDTDTGFSGVLDGDQFTSGILDGKTRVNEERESIIDTLYSRETMRPTLQMERGRNAEDEPIMVDMIDETMHERFQYPITIGEEERAPLTKEQTEGAAQFCVEVFDPNIILISENITPRQKRKLARLMRGKHVRFDKWDGEDLQLLSRTFATREAILAWNYYMMHSSIDERDDFAEAFAQRWEAKKLHQRGQLPEEIRAEAEKKISELNSGINGTLKEMSPEGIASFMKEGGIEDLLVALGSVMFGVYALLYGSKGVQLLMKKWKERKKGGNGVEKYKNNREKAKMNLTKVLEKDVDKMKQKDWKKVLKNLYSLSVIHSIEKKNLLDLSNHNWSEIIKKMKKNGFLEKVVITGKTSEIKDMQARFWACTVGGQVSRIGQMEAGGIRGSAEIIKKRPQAIKELREFQKLREDYNAVAIAEGKDWKFWQLDVAVKNGKGKGKELWEKFKVKKKMAGQSKKWKLLQQLSENKAVYARLKILGVHENEIKLLKSMPKKGGVRKKAIYTIVNEVVGFYNEGSSIQNSEPRGSGRVQDAQEANDGGE